METFITIYTFTHPNELAVIRSRLESEGIECLVLNELTTQVNPFYSNAIGGVQLQVKSSDYENAAEILRDGGYNVDDRKSETPAPNPLLTRLAFYKLSPIARKVLMTSIGIILILLFILTISRPVRY